MLHNILSYLPRLPGIVKFMTGSLVWVAVISWLHFTVNFESSNRRIIKMGYMPVITNLAAPVLDYASKDGDAIRYKALKYASFAEMAESLRNGQIDVAFIIAPLSIVLRQQGEDIKIVYIGNRHESTMVTRKGLTVKSLEDLTGKTVAVPMRFSGHNIALLDMIEKKNLTGSINVVEMNPPDMASALSSGSLDAYFVGEPFAAQTLFNGKSDKFFYAEEVWENFICNLAIVRNDLIEKYPEVVQEVVKGAARTGFWASEHPHDAIKVASKYWNQPVPLLEYAFTTPENRIRYDHYIPREDEMQKMADMMKKLGLIAKSDIGGLVDDRFARAVTVEKISSVDDILKN